MSLEYKIRKLFFHFEWRLFKRAVKHWFQRRTRGWSDDVTWNLNMEMAEWLLPRLKRFKELTVAHPMDLTEKEWDDILDKMIKALELYIEDDWPWDRKEAEKQDKQIKEGLCLLAKRWNNLWW